MHSKIIKKSKKITLCYWQVTLNAYPFSSTPVVDKKNKMSKNKSAKTEFVKWLGPILDALRDLGGSAKPKEITRLLGETRSR